MADDVADVVADVEGCGIYCEVDGVAGMCEEVWGIGDGVREVVRDGGTCVHKVVRGGRDGDNDCCGGDERALPPLKLAARVLL